MNKMKSNGHIMKNEDKTCTDMLNPHICTHNAVTAWKKKKSSPKNNLSNANNISYWLL